jgi:hypothetical protein
MTQTNSRARVKQDMVGGEGMNFCLVNIILQL